MKLFIDETLFNIPDKEFYSVYTEDVKYDGTFILAYKTEQTKTVLGQFTCNKEKLMLLIIESLIRGMNAVVIDSQDLDTSFRMMEIQWELLNQ